MTTIEYLTIVFELHTKDDGWNYGFVIFDATTVKNDANSNDNTPLVNALRRIEAQKKVAKDNILNFSQFRQSDNIGEADVDDDDGKDCSAR